jgi:hypothetical protein
MLILRHSVQPLTLPGTQALPPRHLRRYRYRFVTVE